MVGLAGARLVVWMGLKRGIEVMMGWRTKYKSEREDAKEIRDEER